MITRKKMTKDKAWTSRLKAAKDSRDKFKDDWQRNRRLLLAGFKKSNQPIVKIAWASYQTMIGTIFAKNPSPVVRETREALTNIAQDLTQICAEEFEQMNTRYVTRLCALDVFWAGFGVSLLRLGQYLSDEGKPYDQQYSMSRIHPEAILFDPNAVDPGLSDHKWISIECYPTVAELREDKDIRISEELLDELPRIKGAPSASMSQREQEQGSDEEDDEFAQVRIQEIYDRQNERMLFMATGKEEIIGEGDWKVKPRYRGQLLFPVNLLYFNENPDGFWPVPEMTMIAEEVEQLSVLDRQMLLDAVTKWRAFLAKTSLLQKGHQEKLLTQGSKPVIISVDGNVISASALEQLDLRNVVMPIPENEVKRDVAAIAGSKEKQIHETVGAGDFASAGFRSTRSATEAAALNDFLRSRQTTRTENVDAFFGKETRLLVLFLQETLVEKRSYRFQRSDGAKIWKEITKDDIQGLFLFSVVAGSSMPNNTDAKREQARSFYQLTAPLVVNSGGSLWPLIQWIAPLEGMPQHLVDQLNSGHRGDMMMMAKAVAAATMGVNVPGAAFLELSSKAVLSGLSEADRNQVAQEVAGQLKSAGKPLDMPGGLPGTNTTDQTIS
jgi:hypothetical protein